MENAKGKLQTKLTQLEIHAKRTEQVLQSGSVEAIERHTGALRSTISQADELKRALEALKIEAEEDLDDIGTWNTTIDLQLMKADEEVGKLRKWLENRRHQEETAAREDQLNFEMKLHEQKMKLQTEIVTQASHEGGGSPKQTQAKLPKIEIQRFEGSNLDWPRFWGQFTETIDKAEIAPINKFTYLCGLLGPKVKIAVEALPFTAEGYNRAKSILLSNYGKESEITKAFVKEIMALPAITSANPRRISEFSEKLTYCVQALETMNKLSEVNGNVPMTLDKLPAIRGDLVRTDPDWEKWNFAQLSEAVRLWTKRNPIEEREISEQPNSKRDRPRKLFQARGGDGKPNQCVYCGDVTHRSSECQKISTVNERKQFLARKQLCFNCATPNHRAAECFSKKTCLHCHKRHHSSICDREQTKSGNQTLMTARGNNEGIMPVLTVKVDGIMCRALIDTGAGSSYASAKLLDLLKKKPRETKTKRVEMLMSSKVTKLEVYDTVVESLDGNYQMSVKMTKVNKAQLLSIDNPNYGQLINEYRHLQGVKIIDRDTKEQLPIHVVLGSGEYARVKTETKPQIGQDGEPVAEKTKLGWFIMSPGSEFDHNTMLLTQTSQSDYEDLCRLDVLGLADTPEHDQSMVHAEFKEQLQRSPEGWYETGLPWRGNHPELPTNKQGSIRRLSSLTRKLQRINLTDEYDAIIREQLQNNVVEVAPEEIVGKEFYIPHKVVIRETAETTKMRIVYDASARATPESPSLNECLYPGPPLQNKLWDILVRQRAYPVAVTADIQKAFLQIRIRECERDALRFHWRKSEHGKLEILRFTRALFGLAPSPFLLGGVIEAHLDAWEEREPEMVAELRRSLYVDDLLTGGQTTSHAQQRKEGAVQIFSDATFQLHKWHSNVKQLEEDTNLIVASEEQSFAKQQLNVKPTESKMLGLKWDKEQDTLAVVIPEEETQPTKRGILGKLAKIYDPLGLIAPLTLTAKQIYRELCEAKAPWDAKINGALLQRWKKWEEQLPREQQVPRPIASYQEEIQAVELHSFGDASERGVGAAVYAVVRQPSGNTQRLVVAKSRLAKQGLTIPRLELIAAHMATNLLINVRNALDNLPSTKVFGWLDSTVALHWIKGNGQYKQFVANRVAKIQLYKEIEWRYVPTDENPADLASRGALVHSILWQQGPAWLQDKSKWPINPVTRSSPASEVEAKVIKEVLSLAQTKPEPDKFEELLERTSLRRTLRVCARIKRFIHNCKNKEKKLGPLLTEEIEDVRGWWIKRVQRRDKETTGYPQLSEQLNLKPNAEGVMTCHGRIQGQTPIYLPSSERFTEKLVHQVHCETLHGGVALTMAAVRERYWVPKLRSLVKSVRSKCFGCKRFSATPARNPIPGQLPEDRTTVGGAFEVIGLDFAGPLKYKEGKKSQRNAYLSIFACSLSRAVHLELIASLETDNFISCLKRFIARRGRPRVIYSDNGGTFIKAEKWLRQLRDDERLHGLLEQHEIKWKFNLSRAPWWGGQFERLIGVVKASMYKTIGGATLTWSELNEVLLDVETQVNRRPLSYVEDDVELPILTPATFLYQRTNHLPEEETWRITDRDIRRRAKYLRTCKDQMWSRWQREYLTALRERHNLTHRVTKFQPKRGDVVIVKTDNKNRGTWPLAMVNEVYPGSDGVIRAVQLRTAKSMLERPVQHLYPLELECDLSTPVADPRLNPQAQDSRPRRDAAAAARLRMKQVVDAEQCEL